MAPMYLLCIPFIVVLQRCKALVTDECIFTLQDSNNISSTYDLSQFYFTSDVHEVDDQLQRGFKYKFNICGAIPLSLFVENTSIPSYCRGSDKGPCIDFTDYNNGTVVCNEIYPDTSTKVVPSAVQIISSSTEKSCFWLGTELSSEFVNTTEFPNYKTAPIDADNSAAGIVFTIMNGQFCPEAHNMNRQLSVSLKCPDSTKTEWDVDLAKIISEPVLESPTCVYNLEFASPLACPQQCISQLSATAYAVCSTHGICVADPNAGKSRCICDDGYAGDLCETSISSIRILDAGNEDLITAIIVCTIFVAFFCGIAVYLWFVWRRHIEFNKILDHNAHEYFLNIDDEVDEEDDTMHGQQMHGVTKSKDTFHPVVSVDVSAAKLIHEEQQRERSQSVEEDQLKPVAVDTDSVQLQQATKDDNLSAGDRQTNPDAVNNDTDE